MLFIVVFYIYSWNFNWYVIHDNLAKVHSSILQFSCIPLFDTRNRTYFWEISFLNLFQQTSSKCCHEICHVTIDPSLNRCERKEFKKAIFAVSIWRNLMVVLLGYRKPWLFTKFNVMGGFLALFDVTMDISHGKCTSEKSGHTHRGNFPRYQKCPM